jgi:hypothetical protein
VNWLVLLFCRFSQWLGKTGTITFIMNGMGMKQIKMGLTAGVMVVFAALAGSAQAALSANGDEVTDTSTGLIWRRCAQGQAWTGSTCSGTPTLYTWDQAVAAAQAQALSTGVAWRLPNVKELNSIVSLARISPAIDTVAFPATQSTSHWTSTPYAGFAGYAWIADFNGGYVYGGNRYDYYAVRLVRAGQ